MTSPESLRDPAATLVQAAHAFHRVAEARGSHMAAPEFLASQQEALQVLSAAWYRLAADAVRALSVRGGLTREQEVKLIGALHDIAAAFARCARACREGEATVASVISQRRTADPADSPHPDAGMSWFSARQPPTERVA
jgi:hypothetical protein